MQLEGCFIIISSNLNRKNKQKLENLVHIKFKDIVFYKKNFVENFFQRPRFFQFHRGTRQRGLDSVEYGKCYLILVVWRAFINFILFNIKLYLNESYYLKLFTVAIINDYCIRRCLVHLNDQHFPKFEMRDKTTVIFYFPKFYYFFFQKRNWRIVW